MWTTDCNDHGRVNLTPRPLMPRPICTTATKSCLFSTVPNSPCFCICNPNILSWKHPLIGEVSNDCHKRVINSMPLVSTRWNPTPEQLQALEEMYRRGTRTPSAQQIQQIAAKLRRFGKIEGKNVFYWFQNHKARERQKKRRQIELQAGEIKNRQIEAKVERKPTGLSTRYYGTEHPQKLPTPSSCSTLSEGAECNKKEGWKLQQHIITTGKNETWKLDLSSCINYNTTVQTITAQRTRGEESADQFSALDHMLLFPSKNNNDFSIIESGIKERQTLQLFPVRSIDLEETHQDVSMGGTKFCTK